MLVPDPVRVSRVPAARAQLAPEHRRAVEPALDVREDGLEAQLAARRRGLVVDVDQADVGVGVRRVRVEEAGVTGTEAGHGSRVAAVGG